jgi:Predicted membrane protein/domain
MEDGSTPRSETAGDPGQNGHLPLSARLLGVGVRSARTVTKAAGIDRAVEVAAEEALVAAVESEAVERALARVLQGPVVENAVNGALDSETVKRALVEALDSEMVDEVWRRLLASDEAQKLVERIAEAPEVRSAITAQGAGLIEDIGREAAHATHRLDDGFERVVRRIFFRKRREKKTNRAGVVSRAIAVLLDGAILNATFLALSGVITLVFSLAFGQGGEASAPAIAIGATAWIVMGSLYLISFWALAGQTPGMRFVRIQLDSEQGRRIGPRRAVRRLFGLVLAILPLGAGLWAIVFSADRRGWQDRLAGTEVIYIGTSSASAPWADSAQASEGLA